MNELETSYDSNFFNESHKGHLLYHYTSLNSAISIISTKSLLFGSLSKLNDLNESWRHIYSRCLDEHVIDECERELESYVQISLTCDDNPEVDDSRRGFDIATMWGHYAEGGNGVCIVLNKDRLIKALAQIPHCYHDYVHYKKEYDSAVLFKSSNPSEEIRRYIEDVFFCKSDEWRNEQEYRIVKKSTAGINCVNISGCIEGIIYARLGTSRTESPYNSRGHWALDKVRNGIPLFRYIPRNLNGCRSITSDDDNDKEIWSTGDIIDLESGEWRIG